MSYTTIKLYQYKQEVTRVFLFFVKNEQSMNIFYGKINKKIFRKLTFDYKMVHLLLKVNDKKLTKSSKFQTVIFLNS